jgi:hypothetical protein
VDIKGIRFQNNTSSVLTTVLNTFNDNFEHEYADEAVRRLNAHPIPQSTDNNIPRPKYFIPHMSVINFLAHQDWVIRFIMKKSV